MKQSDSLWCNICGLALSPSEAKSHTSTSSHMTLKQRLEQDLENIQKERYANDYSVVVQWKSSV